MGPRVLGWLRADEPKERALAWRGGARRGLEGTGGTDCTEGGGTDPVTLPNHCSGFGKSTEDCTAWT